MEVDWEARLRFHDSAVRVGRVRTVKKLFRKIIIVQNGLVDRTSRGILLIWRFRHQICRWVPASGRLLKGAGAILRIVVAWQWCGHLGDFGRIGSFWCNHDWICVKTLSRKRISDVTPHHSFCTRVCWVAAVHQCSWDTPITLNRHISRSICPISLIFGQWMRARRYEFARRSTCKTRRSVSSISNNSSLSELWMA